MEIKGFGSYTSVEKHLATLSADEKNELYFSGELDRMLDDAEEAMQIDKQESLNKSYAREWGKEE